ncbi:MAG: hypothetical protein LQ352_007893 [Teloschistes flavicans]|nr:MAG: hypothetical protein LQ352_007893 [Teloschistes flavicans]
MRLLLSLVCLSIKALAPSLARAAPKVLASNLGQDVTKYYVHSLPNVTFSLPPSWAGQIPIPGVSNDELFFWLFQAEHHNVSQNLIIWLNGGPGCSSLTGLAYENGPLKFYAKSAIPTANNASWTRLAHVLYIDQPAGAGYSSGNQAAINIADDTYDLFHWLKAFYDRFPTLKNKNTYLMGESYAGIYIPYLARALISHCNILNINLKAIVLGDPTIGNNAAMTDVVTSTYLNQENVIELYKLEKPILNAFKAADRACGFDQVISQATYPPKGPILIPGDPEGLNFLRARDADNESGKAKSKRQSSCFGQLPDTPALINASVSAPCSGGCATYTTALNYLPSRRQCFTPYNIQYTCNENSNTSKSTNWLNQAGVKKAIHAPNKTFQDCNDTIFQVQSQEYVTPPAYQILPELLAKGMKVHLYAGDLDFLLNHFGIELVLQNMTW